MEATQQSEGVQHHPLTQEQLFICKMITMTLQGHSMPKPSNALFIEGITGTGKTYLLNSIIAHCEQYEIPYISMAYTRMGAIALKNARTVYSRFKMPWKSNDVFESHVRAGTEAADAIIESKIILWDQVTSCNKHILDEVNSTLQELMGNRFLFGGKVVVMTGDFCECLPITNGSSFINMQFNSIRNSTKVWPYLNYAYLTENVRYRNAAEEIELLHHVGYGEYDEIALHPKWKLNKNMEIIKWVYGLPIQRDTAPNMANKTVLTLTNAMENKINQICLDRTLGPKFSFDSIDNVYKIDHEKSCKKFRSMNYFNKILPSDFPDRYISLAPGCPIILKRWFQELQPGTRLVVDYVYDSHAIRAIVTSGKFVNTFVNIRRVRHVMHLDSYNLEFRRYQLPVGLCFAMTVHKAQGLDFERAGLILSRPVFSHGHLYMALSRVKDYAQFKVQVYNSKKQNYEKVQNMVNNQLVNYNKSDDVKEFFQNQFICNYY